MATIVRFRYMFDTPCARSWALDVKPFHRNLSLLIQHRLAQFGVTIWPTNRSLNNMPQSAQAVAELVDRFFLTSRTDERGIITEVNALFCETSGYGREELIGRPHNIIRSGVHSKEFFRDMWAMLRQGEAWHGEVCNRAKNGQLYWVDSFIVPVFDDTGRRGYFSLRYDITSLKQIQATVDGQNNLIEKKRQRLAEIAFMLAHDLRAPLANILGITEALQNGTLNAEQSARMIQAIRTEAERSDVILHRMMQNAVESGALGPV
jgi:PAS domain S-box-containing protein